MPTTWRLETSIDVEQDLSIHHRYRGDELTGVKAAIDSWRHLVRDPFFTSCAIESKPPVKNVSVLMAIEVTQSGYREILAVSEGAKEDKSSWTQFLRELKDHRLKGVELIVSDKCLGLVENLAEFIPTPSGSVVSCISAGTCGRQYRQAR